MSHSLNRLPQARLPRLNKGKTDITSYFSQSVTAIILFSVMLLLSACGLILEDPHPYPDMEVAGDELAPNDDPMVSEE